jgi:hypothetical protein
LVPASEEPAQVRQESLQEPLPVPPKPTHAVEITEAVAPIAEPEAAEPRKAGAAKGKIRSAGTKRAKSKDLRTAAEKASGPTKEPNKEPKVKGSRRKRKSGR